MTDQAEPISQVKSARKPAAPKVTGEYPIGWHVKYQTTEGFEANLFVRGYTGADVLGDAEKALAYLAAHGAKPWQYTKGGGNGAGANGAAKPEVCPIHSVAMQPFTKNGKTWHSHKAVDADGVEYWCSGKAKGGRS
jgi:hypothetical protein